MNSLNAEEQMTDAERHGIVKGTGELNQPRHFRDALNLKWNSKKCFALGKSFSFYFHRKKRLWIHSRLIEIRFDQGKVPENSGYRPKEINLEKLQER